MRRGRMIRGAIGRLVPDGLVGESFARLAPVLYRVRVLIGVSALGVAWVLPGASGGQRLVFVSLVALLYLPYSHVLLVASRRSTGAGTCLASLAGDLLIVFLFHALLPPTHLVAMFGYLLITAFYAFVGGLRVGLLVAAGGMGLTLAAERLTSAAVQLSSYDLTMYGAVLVSFAVLLNAATSEQRRAAGLLEQEVAERTRTEEALRERERQLVEAQALARVGSWHWDIAADVVAWSDQLYRNFGLEPQSVALTFRSFLERVHPDDRSRVEDAITHAYETGEAFAFDHRLVRPDGTVAWHRSTGEAVIGDVGPVRMYGTGQDVTEQKRAEEALREAYAVEKEASDRLRALDEMKNTFLNAVSHDLRTPLTGLLGFARFARARMARLSRDELRECVEAIIQSGERLERMLLDLLDLDRLARGVLEPRRVPTDVGELVMRVARGMDLASHPVALDTPSVVAAVDPAQVERIVENLLANAIRYTPGDCPLWVMCREEADEVVIAVEDAGPGVPDDLKEAVFEPFRQGDGPHESGSGIGLSLVSRFARLHGGGAWVADRPGGGASFVVRLPTTDGDPARGSAVH